MGSSPRAACPLRGAQPAWLQRLLDDTRPPPRLFAWTTANLAAGSGSGSGSGDLPGSGSGDLSGSGNLPAADVDRRIFVVGTGNIGRLLASHLARHADPPPLTLVVGSRDGLAQWRAAASRVELTRAGAVSRTAPGAVAVEWWSDSPPPAGPVREVAGGAALRNLVVATKAAAAMPAADRLRRYLDARSAVAFAQNGMCKLWPPHGDAYAALRFPAGAPAFLACVVSHGLFSLGPFRSVHASAAEAAVGPVRPGPAPPPSAAYLAQRIAAAPRLAARAVSSAELWLLQLNKLVYNTSINPLTALLRCPNGALLDAERPVVARAMDRLLAETSRVLQALVAHASCAAIVAQAGAAPDALADRFAHDRLRARLRAFIARVAANSSSMLQDVQAGRPTEIADLNGWLVDTARFLGIPDLPAHRAVVDLVESRAVLTPDQLGQRLLAL